MSGLGQLDEGSGLAVAMIEPEIAAKDLLVPIGALGADDDRVSVGRNLKRRRNRRR